jgi:hypothetical protein
MKNDAKFKWAFLSVMICIISFLLTSCVRTSDKSSVTLVPVKEYAFNTDWQIGPMFTTLLKNKNGETVFCAYNTKTYKRIDLFTIDGKVIKSISLKNVTDKGDNVDKIVSLSPDSFLIFSLHTNHLYLLNGTGTILKEMNINHSPVDSLNAEFNASSLSDFKLDDSTLLFRCCYYFKNDTLSQSRYSLYDYYRLSDSLPYFFKVRSFLDSQPKVSFELPGLYNRIFNNKTLLNVEASNYIATPKGILLSSFYADSIYLINPQSFIIEKAIKIQSKYTSVGCKALTPAELEQGMDISDRLRPSGNIIVMFYDNYRSLFYIVVKHKAEDDKSVSKYRSLLIYDTDFVLKSEIKMETDVNDLQNMFILKEGLLIHKGKYVQPSKFELFHVDIKE